MFDLSMPLLTFMVESLGTDRKPVSPYDQEGAAVPKPSLVANLDRLHHLISSWFVMWQTSILTRCRCQYPANTRKYPPVQFQLEKRPRRPKSNSGGLATVSI